MTQRSVRGKREKGDAEAGCYPQPRWPAGRADVREAEIEEALAVGSSDGAGPQRAVVVNFQFSTSIFYYLEIYPVDSC